MNFHITGLLICYAPKTYQRTYIIIHSLAYRNSCFPVVMFYGTDYQAVPAFIIEYGCYFITNQRIETKRMRLISDPFVIVERNKKGTVVTCLQESGNGIDIDRSHFGGTDFLFRFYREVGQYIFFIRIKIEILGQFRKFLIRVFYLIYMSLPERIGYFARTDFMAGIITRLYFLPFPLIGSIHSVTNIF